MMVRNAFDPEDRLLLEGPRRDVLGKLFITRCLSTIINSAPHGI